MPGQHRDPTISFRAALWERAMIEERVRASGLHKKDFITRSCIYSNIVVVGTKQRVQYLVEELREMQIVMREITEQILSGDFWFARHGRALAGASPEHTQIVGSV